MTNKEIVNSYLDKWLSNKPNMEPISAKAKYSALLYNKKLHPDFIEDALRAGIKIYLFETENVMDAYFEYDPKLLQNPLFYPYKIDKEDASINCYDGKWDRNVNRNILPTSFNTEQYVIEHFSLNSKALIVKAGAGTGKTKVMIDRIMNLLMTVPSIKMNDICMLTFTNEATNQMRERLQKRLYEYFKVTQSEKYIDLIEQLPSMQISTIDSFMNDLLKRFGFSQGYNFSTELRGLVKEKKASINDAIEEIFIKNGLNFQSPLSLPLYRDLVFYLWQELDTKGYFPSEYTFNYGNQVQFVGPATWHYNNVILLKGYLPQILQLAQAKYKELRQKNNCICSEDVNGALLSIKENLKQGNPWKFLFVDEFQDTDDSQIAVLVALTASKSFKQLFIVGDEKQSIYRFRGATDDAFNSLEKLIPNNTSLELSVNYRTLSGVQKALNGLFLGLSNCDLLANRSYHFIQAYKPGNGIVSLQKYNSKSFGKYDIEVKDTLLQTLKNVKRNNPNKRICVLTRTNKQVQEVMEWCRNEGLICCGETTGNFYFSRPVTDLYNFLGTILFPKNEIWKYNVKKGGYSPLSPETYIDKVKYEPIFNVILEMIEAAKPWKTVNDSYWTQYYKLNLNKLLKILYEKFAGEYASLMTIFSFLETKLRTHSREEDELFPIPPKNSIEAMTVHRAKGLEWDIVFLPFTSRNSTQAIPPSHGLYHCQYTFNVNNEELQIGWKILGNKKNYYENELYDEESEIKENDKENARVLYVAATRCKEQLYCFVPNLSLQQFEENIPNTWAYYFARYLS